MKTQVSEEIKNIEVHGAETVSNLDGISIE